MGADLNLKSYLEWGYPFENGDDQIIPGFKIFGFPLKQLLMLLSYFRLL